MRRVPWCPSLELRRTHRLLSLLAAAAALVGCERRSGHLARSGTDTIIKSTTVKDTTIVRADTTIHTDTVRATDHAADARTGAGAGEAPASTGRARADADVAGLTWGPAPPGLPRGARLAVLRGDPTKAGPFTLRADFPGGYEIRPHWHPVSEHIRVLEGTLLMGRGEHWSESALRPLAAGGEATTAARAPHYVRARERTVVEVRGTGPFQITYVNSADDPRKAPIP